MPTWCISRWAPSGDTTYPKAVLNASAKVWQAFDLRPTGTELSGWCLLRIDAAISASMASAGASAIVLNTALSATLSNSVVSAATSAVGLAFNQVPKSLLSALQAIPAARFPQFTFTDRVV